MQEWMNNSAGYALLVGGIGLGAYMAADALGKFRVDRILRKYDQDPDTCEALLRKIKCLTTDSRNHRDQVIENMRLESTANYFAGDNS